MDQHERYMERCLALAQLGNGHVAPNPMVGAVLVYNDRIIGEGYHEQYGRNHAEVNCINSVAEADQHLIPSATIYVSLEPCAHFGKTPPCADLIIKYLIKKVVIGCRDPFVLVNGRGMDKLQQAGIAITYGVLQQQCIALNKTFFTYHQQQRPYIVLKWAQSANQMIGQLHGEAVKISNQLCDRIVHKWRNESAAILVGRRTALNDNPQLNNRHWSGANLVRLVLDMNLRLPQNLRLFDGSQRTIVFNKTRHEEPGSTQYYKIDEAENIPQQIATAAYQLGLQSILVEGGQMLLQSFIDVGLWDEARVIESKTLLIDEGVGAPVLNNQRLYSAETHANDELRIYLNNNMEINLPA